MNRNKLLSIALLVMFILMGACNDHVWDELPSNVQNFITQYFPFGEVASFTESKDGTLQVQMKNGATLRFDSDLAWISINGNGVPLPDVLLYDQLPSVLYNYLQENEQTASVFALSRGYDTIRVELHDTYIVYNTDTETITYPSAS